VSPALTARTLGLPVAVGGRRDSRDVHQRVTTIVEQRADDSARGHHRPQKTPGLRDPRPDPEVRDLTPVTVAPTLTGEQRGARIYRRTRKGAKASLTPRPRPPGQPN
jgi:hypothetical protein